jgi:hypothetical protein
MYAVLHGILLSSQGMFYRSKIRQAGQGNPTVVQFVLKKTPARSYLSDRILVP